MNMKVIFIFYDIKIGSLSFAKQNFLEHFTTVLIHFKFISNGGTIFSKPHRKLTVTYV